MEFDKKSGLNDINLDQERNFKEVLERYYSNWIWFVLFGSVFFIASYFYVRQIVPEYFINASILIKEKEKGTSFSQLSEFEDLGLFSSGDNSLENEIQILKSRRLMTKVVRELHLNVQYFIEDSPYDKEQYPNSPILFTYESDDNLEDYVDASYKVLVKSFEKFELIDSDDISMGEQRFGEPIKFNMNQKKSSLINSAVINLNENYEGNIIGNSLIVSISPIEGMVNFYKDQIAIDLINTKVSNVLEIALTETNKMKGMTILNNLIEQYNADGINDKNEMAQTTTDFLDLRLSLISSELEAIENTAEQFKSKNKMVNTTAGANIFLQSSSSAENEIVQINTQIQLVNYMIDELAKSDLGELLPGNIGLADPTIIDLIGAYNELVLQKKRILKSSSEINPIIISLNSQLEVLKSNLSNSLNNLRSSMEIQALALNKQSGRISSRIAAVPKNEREYKDIVRQQETKNALYLFLLQKREESILSNAINVSKAKIIDAAYSNGRPISPKKKVSYMAAVLIGLLIPAFFIYFKDALDTKVHDERDLSKFNVPYLGDVPWSSDKKNLLISDGDNSPIAEAFRYIRTNIHFMLDRKDESKTIFITSTQSHEGKTFAAINLARSLAISGKKTLLVGMDLRAPKISKYLGVNYSKGITNFITDDSLDVYEILDRKTEIENLDLIHSGDTPPNPVELLMSKRVDEIFDFASNNYEYLIVDSAPVGMVTDTMQISNYADLSIYIIKSNFLDKRLLHIPFRMFKENKLRNMAFVINGTNNGKGNYGYGYGYGVVKKKNFIERMKSAIV